MRRGMLQLCAFAVLPVLLLPLRAAEAPPPPADTDVTADTVEAEAPAPAPDVEEPPLEPISADNNLTFPVDI